MAIEASPRGNLVSSHGHGGIFDIKLYSRGRPILIANGKGPCGTTDIESTWRHEAMSHSVAVVDGENHLSLRRPYRFDRVVVPHVHDWISEPGRFAYFNGAHEAYDRLETVPCCRRKIFCAHGRYWILIDRFNATPDEHDFQQRFQLGVGGRIEGDRVITEGDGGNLLFAPVSDSCGGPAIDPIPYPYEDYVRPDQLTFTKREGGDSIMVMLLVPFSDDVVPDVDVRFIDVHVDDRPATPWEITGLEITIDGERDVYVDQHMQWHLAWEAGGYEGKSRLFHSALCL